jgi:beta-lactamase regulating signal transducer with metallopeptidase domain
MIQFFSEVGRSALSYLLPSLVQATALAALIGVIDLTLGRRLRAGFRHALWLLVVVKLMLPPTLELPTSAAYWVARWSLEPRQLRVVTGLPEGREAHWELDSAPSLPSLHAYGDSRGFDVPGILLLLWTAGAGALAVVILRRQRDVRRLLRDSSAAGEDLEVALNRAAREVGLARPPRLRLTSENHSPAVCGLLTPVILLPRALADSAGPELLRGILLHELVHIRRRDLWLNVLQIVVQIAWWWNPIAWLSNARVRFLRELAVDQEVQRLHGADDPTSYPAALVAVARHCSARPMLALSFVGILESSRALKQRVESLLQYPVPTRTHLGKTGWAGVLILALVLLPMGFSPRVEIVAAEARPPAPDSTPAAHQLRLRELAKGSYEVDGQTLALDQLTSLLKQRAAADPQLILSLVGTSSALEVIETARAAGITRFSIDVDPPAGQAPAKTSDDRQRIQDRLDRIQLSGLSFSSTPLSEAIQAIADRARLADPEKKGFNHILTSDAYAPDGSADDIAGIQISWLQPVGELSVSEILQRIAKSGDAPFRFRVEDYAVVFSPAGPEGPAPLISRRFRVNTNTFVRNLEQAQGKPASRDGLQASLREHLIAQGMESLTPPAGTDPKASPPQNLSAVFYNDRTGTLFVRAPKAEMLLLEKILGLLNRPPHQIQIETLIVEVDAQELASLKLDDVPSAEPSKLILLTPADLKRLMNDLDRRRGVDIVAAPKITTLENRQASVRIGPDEGEKVGQTPTGITVDVLPWLEPDEVTVNLSVTGELAGGAEGSKVAGTFRLPDRHTAVLVGAKVTGNSGKVRRHLLLVTPTLIDPAGQPIHPK